jgi:hypothetical protein
MKERSRPASAEDTPLDQIGENQDAPISTPVTASDRVIVLDADWREYLAGRVLKVDADLESALSTEGVPHHDATEQERAIGGVR